MDPTILYIIGGKNNAASMMRARSCDTIWYKKSAHEMFSCALRLFNYGQFLASVPPCHSEATPIREANLAASVRSDSNLGSRGLRAARCVEASPSIQDAVAV